MLVKFIQGVIRPYYSQFTPGDNSVPTYLKKDGNNVAIRASEIDPIIVNFCDGDKNYLYQESTDKVAWKNLLGRGPVWLYWELADGKILYGYTKLEPASGLQFPEKPKHGQDFFSYADRKMYAWDSRTKKWEKKLRVFCTKYEFQDSPTITNEFKENKSQVGLSGEFEAGFLVFDSSGTAIHDSEQYFTDSTPFSVEGFNFSSIKQENAKGHAIESIPQYHCVSWKGPNRQMGLNSYLDPDKSTVGISIKGSPKFDTVEFITQGYIHDPIAFDWNESPNTYLFVAKDGSITTKTPHNISLQRVGYVVDRSTIYVEIREKILFNAYFDETPICVDIACVVEYCANIECPIEYCTNIECAEATTGHILWASGGTGNTIYETLLANNDFSTYQNKFWPSATQINAWNLFDSSGSFSYNIAGGIKEDGTLWLWGDNRYGSLGINDQIVSVSTSPLQEYSSSDNWCNLSVNAHTLAIKEDGTLWGWGKNDNFALGLGVHCSDNIFSPTQIGYGSNWLQTTTTSVSSAAIKKDGTLWTWGPNLYGQLANGTYATNYEPMQEITNSTNWCFVNGGNVSYGRMAALKTDGSLWQWGAVTGSTTSGDYTITSPEQEVSLSSWKSLAVGWSWINAIKDDGTLWSWGGQGYRGGHGTGDIYSNCSPVQEYTSSSNWCKVSASYLTAALKDDGTVWTWGTDFLNYGRLATGTWYGSHNRPLQEAQFSNDWIDVKSSYYHTFALKKAEPGWRGYLLNGTVNIEYLTRFYVYGGTGPYTIYSTNLPDGLVATMQDPAFGLVVVYGTPTTELRNFNMSIVVEDSTGRRIEVSQERDFTYDNSSLWLTSTYNTSNYYDWSRSRLYKCGAFRRELGSINNDWKVLSPSNNGGAVIKQDGTLWTWGLTPRADGSLPESYFHPENEPHQELTCDTTWCDVKQASFTIHAIKEDGSFWSWGGNRWGQIANGYALNAGFRSGPRSPTQELSSSTDWCSVLDANGSIASGAIKKNGTLWLWGSNNCCVVGRFGACSFTSPVQEVCNFNNWLKGGFGATSFGAVLRSDGSIWTWGSNRCGTLATGSTSPLRRSNPGIEVTSSSDWCDISVGWQSVSALKTDGSLWSWGVNCRGQLATGQTTGFCATPVQEVTSSNNWCGAAVGGAGFMAGGIKVDGTVWVWGTCASIPINKSYTSDFSNHINSPTQEALSATNWCRLESHTNVFMALKRKDECYNI